MRVTNATGGTFTVTFNGQTTAPIAVERHGGADHAALDALSNIGPADVLVTQANNTQHVGNGNQTVTFRGPVRAAERGPDDDRSDGAGGTDADRRRRHHPGGRLVPGAARRRPPLVAQHQRPARQGAADQGQRADELVHDPVRQPVRRRARRAPGPRSTPWASATRSGSRSTSRTSRTSPTTRRMRASPACSTGRPARAASRSCARRPTTAGRCAWAPTCRCTGGTSATRQRSVSRTSATTPRTGRRTPRGTTRASRRTPPLTQPDIWYSYNDNAVPPQGTPCFAGYDGSGGTCPQLFPGMGVGGVGPHGADSYEYDPDNPSETKFPPYYDGKVFFGEFTRDALKEVVLDSQNRDPADQPAPELRPGADHDAVPVRVRQPDGRPVRRRRGVLHADLRRRLLRRQPGRRHVPLRVRHGASRRRGRRSARRPPTAPPRSTSSSPARARATRTRVTRSGSSGTSRTTARSTRSPPTRRSRTPPTASTRRG